METTLLLFVLFYASTHPEVKESLLSFAKFYRENRELIATFAQNGISMPEVPLPETPKKNRPQNEAGDLRIIEEYLNKLG